MKNCHKYWGRVVGIIFLTLFVIQLVFPYTEKSGTIGTESWTSGTYYITSDLIVDNGATLTISAGVVVKFATGVQMNVNGTLSASGTSGSKITFTSKHDNSVGETISGSSGSPSAGDWDGIYVNTTYFTMDYCVVKYGGRDGGGLEGNIHFNNSSSGSFTDGICAYSSRNGLYAGYSSTPTIQDNDFNNNVEYGVFLYRCYLTSFAGNTGSSNGYNCFAIQGGWVNDNHYWSCGSTTFPFMLRWVGPGYESPTVNSGKTLTIQAGAILKFDTSTELFVAGTLDVNGTADTNVIFTSWKDANYGGDSNGGGSDTPTAGDWSGIYCYGGTCDFDYCRVRYGGKDGERDANVQFYNTSSGHFINSISEYSDKYGIYINYASPTISNSTIQYSSDDGIYSYGTSIPIITDNTLTSNSGYGVHLYCSNLTSFSGNTGTGNTYNGFAIEGGSVDGNYSWSSGSTSFPFVILYASSYESPTVNSTKTLTIPAGQILKFGTNAALNVYGTLDVNGTSGSGNNVVFTSLKDDTYGGNTDNVSATPAAGDWRGINLYHGGSYQGIGQLDYCLVRYGGSSNYGNVYFNGSDAGNFTNSISEYSSSEGIYINACSPTITNSTIRYSDEEGLYAQGSSAAPVITNNTFNNNTLYGVYLNGVTPTAYSGNTGSNNGTNAFRIGTSVAIASNLEWSSGSNDFPIELYSSVSVNSGVTLTVSSGTLRCKTVSITGAGTFTLSSGATIELGDVDGIWATNSWGNIRTTGRNLSSNANYTFNGTSAQVTGTGFPSTVNNLKINNSSGVTLSGNVSVNGTLILANGNLTTGSYNVTVGTSTSALGDVTRTAGTVVGNVKRWFATSTVSNVLFPVGTASYYRPLNISFTDAPGSGGTLTAKFLTDNPGTEGLPLNDGGVSITRTAAEGQWSLTRGNEFLGGTYTLDLTADGFAGVTDYTLLRILYGGVENWSLAGTHSAGTGSNSTPIAHRTGLTEFEYNYCIGSPNENPLPVELVNVTGVVDKSDVTITWSTASERNNFGFEIERRVISGSDWQKVGFVEGAGTSTEKKEYSFVDIKVTNGRYAYRIKQVDRNGMFKYSHSIELDVKVVPTKYAAKQNYPNPFNPSTTIAFDLPKQSVVSLRIFDALGREVETLVSGELAEGTYDVVWNASKYSSGIYYYHLEAKEFKQTRKLLLVK